MYNFTDARFIEQYTMKPFVNDFVYKYYKLCAI